MQQRILHQLQVGAISEGSSTTTPKFTPSTWCKQMGGLMQAATQAAHALSLPPWLPKAPLISPPSATAPASAAAPSTSTPSAPEQQSFQQQQQHTASSFEQHSLPGPHIFAASSSVLLRIADLTASGLQVCMHTLLCHVLILLFPLAVAACAALRPMHANSCERRLSHSALHAHTHNFTLMTCSTASLSSCCCPCPGTMRCSHARCSTW